MDALGLVAVKPIEFSIKTETPYVNLAVPKYYKLNDYNVITETKYVSKFENRINKLRKGAEDELIQVDTSSKSNSTKVDKKAEKLAERADFLRNHSSKIDLNEIVKDNKETVTTESVVESDSSGPQIIDLEAPAFLAQPIEYPPMHIFVRKFGFKFRFYCSLSLIKIS